jgi:hypothetical protein
MTAHFTVERMRNTHLDAAIGIFQSDETPNVSLFHRRRISNP